MTRFAVPLHDLDVLWRTPAGSALVEASLEDEEVAEVVTIRGTDAVVLRGPAPRIAAISDAESAGGVLSGITNRPIAIPTSRIAAAARPWTM
mgnify:CR=1 FL=1